MTTTKLPTCKRLRELQEYFRRKRFGCPNQAHIRTRRRRKEMHRIIVSLTVALSGLQGLVVIGFDASCANRTLGSRRGRGRFAAV